MSISPLGSTPRRAAQAAFSMVEVLVGLLLVAFLGLTLYVGMSQGFAVIQLARENLRATQVLQEKMEAVRLLSWSQLEALQTNAAQLAFTAPFYATATQTTEGLTYEGWVTITNAPLAEAYADDLRLVVVDLTWMSGNVERRRQMRTLVSKYGLQNYIYDPL